MASFWVNSHVTTVNIPTTFQKEHVTLYDIKVSVGDIFWFVSHRYNDFYELHTKLVYDHGVTKDILPLKKIIRAKCPEFIDTRRRGLEIYLQKVLRFLKLTMPRVFLEFLDFHIYDVYFLLQSLALRFYVNSETCLSLNNNYNFTTLEMHAISECCNTPQPAEYNPDRRYDFTHVLDFCIQLNHLEVTGKIGSYLRSNILPNDLPFDFKNFKKISNLKLKDICLDCIKDLGQLRKNLKTLCIHNSNMTSLSQILQCDVLHKYNFDSTHMWSNLVHMDLSYNCLTEIDQTIKLVTNLKVLILDQNRFSNIPNLIDLKNLTTLSICGNLITSCKQVHLCFGNISHLNLSQNSIVSLEGFTKLYSLETLNLTGNNISNIEEIKYLSNLPCLEDLKLTGNSVSTIVDYRVRVLEYFGKRAEQICLDNEQPLQPELDKVSIRKALKILKDGELPEILNAR